MSFYDTQMPPLETERLLIRRFDMEDQPDFHRRLTGDPDWWDSCSYDEAGEALAFRIRQTSYKNPPLGYRAVVRREDQALIGTVGYESYFLGPQERALYDEALCGQEAPFRSLELRVGYLVAPEYRRKGYAGEAVGALIDFAFTVIGVRRLWAESWHGNTASIALVKHLGMRIGVNPDPEGWPGVFGVAENPS